VRHTAFTGVGTQAVIILCGRQSKREMLKAFFFVVEKFALLHTKQKSFIVGNLVLLSFENAFSGCDL
jgi:hypothetical protein